MITRLLRLARATAESLEADKHRDNPDYTGYVEIKLLQQVEKIEEFIADGRTTHKKKRRILAPAKRLSRKA